MTHSCETALSSLSAIEWPQQGHRPLHSVLLAKYRKGLPALVVSSNYCRPQNLAVVVGHRLLSVILTVASLSSHPILPFPDTLMHQTT